MAAKKTVNKTTPKKKAPAKKPIKASAGARSQTTAKAQRPAPPKPAAKAPPKKADKKVQAETAANATGIAEGDRAPSFVLRDQDGSEVRSDSLRGTPYVLYFYPKDDTPGCTTQACGFRDNARGFGKSKVRVLGVSPDSEASHARFAKKYGLPFTLLSDPEKKLAEAYGVWVEKQNYGRKYMGIQRSTFLVDGKGVVKKVYRGVRVPGHVEAVLEATSEL
jgi:peroxiredoxin Q/BCP